MRHRGYTYLDDRPGGHIVRLFIEVGLVVLSSLKVGIIRGQVEGWLLLF